MIFQWTPHGSGKSVHEITKRVRLVRITSPEARSGYLYYVEYRRDNGSDDWIPAPGKHEYKTEERAVNRALDLDRQVQRELKGWM